MHCAYFSHRNANPALQVGGKMNSTERVEAAAHAAAKCAEFSAALNAAKAGTRKWRDATYELKFWQGMLSVMQAQVGVAA